MIYFTSDLHLGHEKVIKYCNRPFTSIEEMDSVLIANWNSAVKNKDIVYFLGDFTLGNKVQAQKYFSQLNGKIFCIETKKHHDRAWLKKEIYLSKNSHIIEYLPPIFEFSYEKKYFVCTHFPMREWNKSYHGSFNLHGHSHANIPDTNRFIDIGTDNWNFFPVSIDRIVSKATETV